MTDRTRPNSPSPDIAPLLNRLHRTDALQFARTLPDQSIDMLFTDPPYSSGGLHASTRAQSTMQKYINTNTKTVYEDFESDNMDQRSWAFWCHAWLAEGRRALKPGGLLVCFIDWRQLPTLTDVIQAAGFIQRGIAVWDKTPSRARPRRGGFKQQAEFIVWASKGAVKANDIYLPGGIPMRAATAEETPDRKAARAGARGRAARAERRGCVRSIRWIGHVPRCCERCRAALGGV